MTETRRFPDVLLLTAGNGLALQPVGGLPLVERVLANGRAEGARHVVANSFPDETGVLAHFGGLVKVSRQETDFGHGGAIRQALPMLHSDPFFVMQTTGFWPAGSDAPLLRMLERHTHTDHIVLLCAHPRQAHGVRRSHDFCLSPHGLITRDYGAPVLFAGVALLGKSVFAQAPDGSFALDWLFDRALDAENLLGVVLDAPWFAITDAVSLAEADRHLAP